MADRARARIGSHLALDRSDDPAQFQFAGSRQPLINRTWVVAMLQTSHGDRGLTILSEAEAEAAPAPTAPPAA